MAIEYRKASLEDAEIITEYRITFLKELHCNMERSGTGPAIEISVESADRLRISLRAYLDGTLSSDEFIAYIAEDGGRPVGFGGMVIQSIPGSFMNISGKLGYILNIYTIDSHRGRGIGSEIMKRLISDGSALGIGKLSLHASEMGIGVYRKLGFHESNLPELVMSLEGEE